MNRLTIFLLALFFLVSCQSSVGHETEGRGDAPPVQSMGEDCICGTPEGDLHGCHCSECLFSGGNRSNPDCSCLPLGPRERASGTYTSLSSGEPSSTRVPGGLVGMDELRLLKGGKVKGEVVTDDGEQVFFRRSTGGTVVYTYEELDFRMVYRLLKARSKKGDPEDELKLATYARDCGLYAHSRRHYGRALEADPGLEAVIEVERAILRDLASKSELERAKQAYMEKDDKQARAHLATLLQEFPGEEATRSAEVLLREIQTRSMGADQARVASGIDPQVVDQLTRVGERFEELRNQNAAGLTAEASPGKAVRAYKAAISAGESAQRELKRLERGADPALLEGARAYAEMILDGLAETYRHLANHYFTGGDYNKALASVNKGLALRPQDDAALQLRARIQSSQDSYKQGYEEGRSDEQEVQGEIGLYRYYGGGRLRRGALRRGGGYFGGMRMGIGRW